MSDFELLIRKRPQSLQVRTRRDYQDWKSLVNAEAAKRWGGRPPRREAVRLTIVTLCHEPRIDVDNVIKPIQDALIGLVYPDDRLVTDVDSHRRVFGELIDLDPDGIPPLLFESALDHIECVYVRVDAAPLLGEVL